MNLLDARIVLRPRKLTEILDLAFLYTHASRKLVRRISMAVLLPSLALCLTLRHALDMPWGWVWLIAYGLASLSAAPYTLLASRLLFSERTSTRRVLVDFARAIPRLGVARVGAFFLRTMGAAVVGVFLPMAMAHTLFLDEAILLEQMPVGGAFSRASAVVRRQLAPGQLFALASLLIMFLGVVFIEMVGNLFLDYVLQWHHGTGWLWDDGGSTFALLGLFWVVPYLANAKFLLYIDLRTRKEGWDLQLKFQALAQTGKEDA